MVASNESVVEEEIEGEFGRGESDISETEHVEIDL
jgi:hypothetical protein